MSAEPVPAAGPLRWGKPTLPAERRVRWRRAL